MKKVNVFLVSLALLSGMLFSTAAVVDTKVKSPFSEEIVKLLELPPNFNTEVKTSVNFLINLEGEIVVLYVDTKDPMVDYFIKNRLNYKTISTDLIKGKEYKVPILFTLEL